MYYIQAIMILVYRCTTSLLHYPQQTCLYFIVQIIHHIKGGNGFEMIYVVLFFYITKPGLLTGSVYTFYIYCTYRFDLDRQEQIFFVTWGLPVLI